MADGLTGKVAHRPSASAIARSLSCESSAVLPRSPEAPRVYNSPSKKGDRIHRAVERYSLGARREDVEAVILPYDCGNLWEVLDAMPKLEAIAGLGLAEVELWLNPLTEETLIGVKETPVADGYWRGTADLVGMYQHETLGRMPCVMDAKSGNPKYQEQGECAQTAYFAVCLRSMLQAPLVAGIIYCTQDWLHPRVHVYDEKDLDRWSKTFSDHEARLTLIEAGLVEPTLVRTDKNCKWCPSKPVCPAWQKGDGDAKS